jgi:hypothetical protein
MSFYAALDSFRNWDGFHLEPAKVVGSTNIFGIAEFISTLALLVVIVTLSEFRYRYRFAVQRLNVRTLGTSVAATIGALLLLTEFWFQNSLPTPRFLNSYSNLKIILAAAFLLLVFYVVVACFLRPPKSKGRTPSNFLRRPFISFIRETLIGYRSWGRNSRLALPACSRVLRRYQVMMVVFNGRFRRSMATPTTYCCRSQTEGFAI